MLGLLSNDLYNILVCETHYHGVILCILYILVTSLQTVALQSLMHELDECFILSYNMLPR